MMNLLCFFFIGIERGYWETSSDDGAETQPDNYDNQLDLSEVKSDTEVESGLSCEMKIVDSEKNENLNRKSDNVPGPFDSNQASLGSLTQPVQNLSIDQVCAFVYAPVNQNTFLQTILTVTQEPKTEAPLILPTEQLPADNRVQVVIISLASYNI